MLEVSNKTPTKKVVKRVQIGALMRRTTIVARALHQINAIQKMKTAIVFAKTWSMANVCVQLDNILTMGPTAAHVTRMIGIRQQLDTKTIVQVTCSFQHQIHPTEYGDATQTAMLPRPMKQDVSNAPIVVLTHKTIIPVVGWGQHTQEIRTGIAWQINNNLDTINRA